MARKGQKFNKYKPEFKIEVAEAYLSNKYGGFGQVSKKFNVNSTIRVKQWVDIYKQNGANISLVETRGRSGTGRPMKRS